jgi:uncharacterized membrane protein
LGATNDGFRRLAAGWARGACRHGILDRTDSAQDLIYGPVIDWARRSALHTDALGHSLHPLLTDLTLGCWTSASLLDLAGGAEGRRAATLLVGAGLAAAGPTAIAGAGDWAEMSGADRRIGAVHAVGTDVATFLLVGSLAARLRGRYAAGAVLGLAGNAVVAAAGFLGGHLALNRGTARRTRQPGALAGAPRASRRWAEPSGHLRQRRWVRPTRSGRPARCRW